MGKFAATVVVAFFAGLLAAQSPETTPRFEIADIHTSAKTQRLAVRPVSVRNGRYELGNATMLDLIRNAWGLDADHIVGGPNWLELDRFDIIAKVPADSNADAQKLMLQALLKDRFKLVVHEETRPVPQWALSLGKKPLMKEADGSGDTGCKLQTGAAASPAEGARRLMMSDANGKVTQINLGPDSMVQFSCRNMTMPAFAEGLRTMLGAQINTPVFDRTGLKGMWNFELKWSLPFIGPMAATAGRVSSVEAIDKQLGLKLEEIAIPQSVLVVEKVERQPTENAPEVKEMLPPLKPPTEFEVADVKLASPPSPGNPVPLGMRVQPGGRFTATAPMRFLLNRAFNTNSNDQLAGVPSWVDSVWVSITAKVAGDYPAAIAVDPEFIAPALRALLAERFGLESHTEQRPGTAYNLVAAKPKMKKADPDSRIFCRNLPPSPGRAAGNQVLNCQNTTMQLFAERLQNMAAINAPVADTTGLEGGWDFTFSFNPLPLALIAGPGRGGGGGDSAAPGQIAASDPTGVLTIFESLDKQLGLKLEAQKKPVPLIVIDKLNQKPTDN